VYQKFDLYASEHSNAGQIAGVERALLSASSGQALPAAFDVALAFAADLALVVALAFAAVLRVDHARIPLPYPREANTPC
jgi:hypothetical protein